MHNIVSLTTLSSRGRQHLSVNWKSVEGLYATAMLATGFLFATLLLYVAWQQWFVAEDFPALAQAAGAYPQYPSTWRQFFLPDRVGWNWAYRPVPVESFFHLMYPVFGLNAKAYMTVAIVAHLGSGLLLFYLAKRLDLHWAAAGFAALFSLLRFPSAHELFHLAIITYPFAKFFMLAAVLLALQQAQTPGLRALFLLASSAATTLALLSNELAVALPLMIATALVWDRLAGQRLRSWPQIALAVMPHAVLGVAYLIVRFQVIVLQPQPEVYGASIGAHVFWNSLSMVREVFQTWGMAALVLAVCVGPALLLLLKKQSVRHTTGRWLLGTSLLALVWLGLLLAPFSVLMFPQPRFSLAAEIPVSLLLGVFLSVAWGAAGRWRGTVAVTTVVLLLVSTPWLTLHERATDPRGDLPLSLLERLEERWVESPPQDARVIVLYGGDGLASAQQREHVWFEIFGGAVLAARYPQSRPALEMYHVDEAGPVGSCESCIQLKLHEDLRFRHFQLD